MRHEIANPNRTIPTLAEYAAGLREQGRPILQSSGGTFWVWYEMGAMMRLPTFRIEPPSKDEVREVLWRGRTALAMYLLPPDERHTANSWLYICTDDSYALDKLAPAMRRNVNRGFKELKIAPLSLEQLLAHGVQAFCDTRQRIGLSDGTAEGFRRRFTLRGGCRGHVFLGAWKYAELAAFLSIAEVDDWAEIVGCFSMDSLLQSRPNDTLFFYALSHYLTERRFRLVSYGLSSIQAVSNAIGLHAFKTKIGFEAKPVHRIFEAHPLLRPFLNAATLWAVKKALSLVPRDRRLKKAEGMLACILGNRSIAVAGGNRVDE
jgi:hypothetical protein